MTLVLEEILETEETPEQIFFEFDRMKCDIGLRTLIEIDKEIENVNSLADKEIQMIEGYKNKELDRLNKKIFWITCGLEKYIRNSGEKTIHLVHGTMKIRQSRDRVEIEDITTFLPAAKNYGLLRTIPEKEEPDLTATLEYIKKTRRIPPGAKLIPGTSHFLYNLTKGGNDGEEKLPTKG